MKHSRLLLLVGALVAMLGLVPGSAAAGDRDAGRTMELTRGLFGLAIGTTRPAGPLRPAASPLIYRQRDTGWMTGDFHTIVGRYAFDRAIFGPRPLGLCTIGTRNEFTVYLNGAEVFRNYARLTDQKLAWYRPYYIPLPQTGLIEGNNRIEILVSSQEAVGIGRLILGGSAEVQHACGHLFFWRITMPEIANGAMLLLGLLAFLLWLSRRSEGALLFLALSTVLWFMRNYQYFAEVTPFAMAWFNPMTVHATYYGSVATAAFYLDFIQLPQRKPLVAGMLMLGAPLSLVITVFPVVSNVVLYIPANAIAFGLGFVGLYDLRQNRSLERVILVPVMLLMPVLGMYDFIINLQARAPDGYGFYLAVFSGLIYTVAFFISFGIRAVDAFTSLSTANQHLAQRIAETRAELAASEALRQKLVVGSAVASERERLMQEMHDGIGSNLISALAVARQQKQPDATIRTLRRALADLKLTVDSLEPVEGDLVALIGNLRHRMAGDLREAGIDCRWEMGQCTPLTWLDATNALHVLRIFQEAIGNVLTHSGANELRIGCADEVRGGVDGIAAYVADNGRGFLLSDPARRGGRGLNNIRARAASLHGALDCRSRPGEGTTITLWLPHQRQRSVD